MTLKLGHAVPTAMEQQSAFPALQASLGRHRLKIEGLRELEERLNARIARLSELSQIVQSLIDGSQRPSEASEAPGPKLEEAWEAALPVLQSVGSDASVATLSNPQSPSSRRNVTRSVSWVSQNEERPVAAKEDEPRFPPHGHWVPLELLERRASFQGDAALKLGGRQVQLQTRPPPPWDACSLHFGRAHGEVVEPG